MHQDLGSQSSHSRPCRALEYWYWALFEVLVSIVAGIRLAFSHSDVAQPIASLLLALRPAPAATSTQRGGCYHATASDILLVWACFKGTGVEPFAIRGSWR